MGAQRRLPDMPPVTEGTRITSAPVIQLHPKDSVVIARASLLPGAPVADGVAAAERIPPGHKVAVVPVALGEPVRVSCSWTRPATTPFPPPGRSRAEPT